MKFYNTPEIETLKFAIAEDVICTSMDDAGRLPGSDGTNDEDDAPLGQ